MGKLTLLLLALLVWLQYSLWFGKNGLHDYSRVSDDVAAQQATNAKLKARNDQLFAEIDDLNGGQEAIEERARNELSMTKPGETFIVWFRMRLNAIRAQHKIIDNQAQDYDMAATFRTSVPWCRPQVLAGACRQNVLSSTFQLAIKRSLSTPWRAAGAPEGDARGHRHQPGDARFAQLPLANHPQITVVDGGAERADSVLAGIQASGNASWVLVHDAARPCLHQDDLARLLALSETNKVGGILAAPVRDTMKRAEPGKQAIAHTVERVDLWHALTPQFFPANSSTTA